MSPLIVDASGLTRGVWKYVVTKDQARFVLIETQIQHRQMILPGEVPIHAGYLLFIDRQQWKLKDPVSESLQIYGDEETDARVLTGILGCAPMEKF